MAQVNTEIQHLYTLLNFKDDISRKQIELLGVSDINDFKVLEDEDVDNLSDANFAQKRKLKTIIRFLKIADIESNATFERIRKYTVNSEKEIHFNNVNLPHYDDSNQELNTWRSKVECIMRQHGMSDLLDNTDFAEAQPKATKTFYSMLYLALEGAPVLSLIENIANKNGFEAWHALCAFGCKRAQEETENVSNSSSNGVNSSSSFIDLPEHLTNRLSKRLTTKVKNRVAELNQEILMEIKTNVVSSKNDLERNNRLNGKIKLASISQTVGIKQSRDMQKRLIKNKEYAKGFGDGTDSDETISCSDDFYGVKEKNSRKRGRILIEKDATMHCQDNHSNNALTTYHGNENENNDTNESISKGPTHTVSRVIDNETNDISHKNKVLKGLGTNNVEQSTVEPQIEPEINPKNSDILFDTSSTSYDNHPGNYRLKHLIHENHADAVEIIYLKYQILYPGSRFLQNNNGWKIMTIEKISEKIIFY